jgi:glutaredoxin
MSITIYGIKNCDTMKTARAWLDAHGVAYAFHDYKVAGVEKKALEHWVKEAGWETVLNRAGGIDPSPKFASLRSANYRPSLKGRVVFMKPCRIPCRW